MFQRIFPHYLSNGKCVVAGFFKRHGPVGNIFAHFKNIIHSAALPATGITAQVQIYFLKLHGIAGCLRAKIKPDIVIAIGISVAQNDVNIVGRGCIGNAESKGGLIVV